MEYIAAICDDNETDLRYLSSLVSEWAGNAAAQAKVETYPSAEAFLFRYAENKAVDFLLLDIEMGGAEGRAMDGVRLAKEIREENDAVQIIFVTGYSDYIAEGYEVSALHYLMKPVDKEKLFSTLERAAARLGREERTLLLELPGETVRVPLGEIRFIEVQRNYVTVHARRPYTVKRTLAEMERALDERFFRVGRSAIVNLGVIRRVTKSGVYLADGACVALPRGMYEPLNRAIIERT